MILAEGVPVSSVAHPPHAPVEAMSRIVAFTGHRPDIFREPEAARDAVNTIAQNLVVHDKADHFLVGGQRGVDTWAALPAINLGVPFTLILPLDVAQFTSDWLAADRALLDSLATQATEVRIIARATDPAAMYTERNRQLAEQADL